MTPDLIKDYETNDRRMAFSVKYANDPIVKDYFITKYNENFDDNVSINGANGYDSNIFAAYAEGDLSFSKNLALKVGLRYSNNSLLNENNIAPRASLGYKVSKSSQFSFAYGDFSQTPVIDYIKYSKYHQFESEKATFEVNAEQAGVLTTLGKEGDTLLIGDVLAKIDETAPRPAAASVPAAPAPAAPKSEAPVAAIPNDVKATPVASAIIADKKVDPTAITATGTGGDVRRCDPDQRLTTKDSAGGIENVW